MSSRGIGAVRAEAGARVQSVHESLNERSAKKREAQKRRTDFNGERLMDAYFAVLTIVIVAMIVGLAFYTVRYVIPEWERHHPPRDQHYPTNFPFQSPQSDSSQQ